MRCRTCKPLPEEVARAADLLGRRWVLAILWASAEAGAVRFNEFKQALEGIPPRTLALQLDLTDTLACDPELATNLLERHRVACRIEPVAADDHASLALRELRDRAS